MPDPDYQPDMTDAPSDRVQAAVQRGEQARMDEMLAGGRRQPAPEVAEAKAARQEQDRRADVGKPPEE